MIYTIFFFADVLLERERELRTLIFAISLRRRTVGESTRVGVLSTEAALVTTTWLSWSELWTSLLGEDAPLPTRVEFFLNATFFLESFFSFIFF